MYVMNTETETERLCMYVMYVMNTETETERLCMYVMYVIYYVRNTSI